MYWDGWVWFGLIKKVNANRQCQRNANSVLHPKSEKLCRIRFSVQNFAEKVHKMQRQIFATKVRKSSKLCQKGIFVKNLQCNYN